MGFVPFRRARLNQPSGDRIDWSNPLTKGLQLCINNVNDVVLCSAGTRSGTKQVATVKGTGCAFGASLGTGTSDYLECEERFDPIVSSLISVAYINGLGANSFGRFVDTGSLSPESLYMDTSLGFRYTRSFTSGLRSRTWGSSISSLFGTVCTVGASYDASNTTNLPVIYLNGNRESGSATTPDAQPTGTVIPRNTLVHIGNRKSDLARNFDGVILLTLRFGRFLSDAEHASIHSNPWQIFL